MKSKLLQIKELKKYSDYVWEEISIGCSDTYVYKISKASETLFLKVGKSGLLTKEYLNLKKLKEYVNVPDVVFYYNQDMEILVTTPMPGIMSCEDECIDSAPSETLDIMCEAVKKFQSIPLNQKIMEDFNHYSVEEEINLVKAKASSGEFKELPDKPIFKKFKDINEVVEYLENNVPEGELCLSHGDISMPNVFIKDGELSGFIDVGNAGIRTKWLDITDAYISIRRNFESQEMANEFLKRMGIVDRKQVEYYEILNDLL